MATPSPNNNNTEDVGMGGKTVLEIPFFVENVRWEVKGERQEGVSSRFPRGGIVALLSP